MPNYINYEGIFLNGIKVNAYPYPPPAGVDAAVGSLWIDTNAGKLYQKQSTGWTNSISASAPGVAHVSDFGITADGSTDETTKLQDAVLGTPAGGVLLMTGLANPIRTSAPVDLIEQRSYMGDWEGMWPYRYGSPWKSSIKALSGFAGDSLLRIRAKSITGRTLENDGIYVGKLNLDLSAANNASNIDDFRVEGLCRDLFIERVSANHARGTGRGFHMLTGAGTAPPRGLRMVHTTAYAAGAYGYRMNGVTDAHFDDILAVSCLDHGFYASNSGENEIRGRMVFNGGDGWFFDGNTTVGMTTLHPATDRNAKNGIRITATGTAPYQIVAPRLRRDGRLSMSGDYAAIAIVGSSGNKVAPVDIVIPQATPGLNDAGDSYGTNLPSPQWGVRASWAQKVAIVGGEIWAVDGGITDAGNVDEMTWTKETHFFSTPGSSAGVLGTKTRFNSIQSGAGTRVEIGGMAGDLGLTSSPARWYNDTGQPVTLCYFRAVVGTAPVGSSIVLNVRLNGTNNTALTIPAAANSNTLAYTTPITVPSGSYVDVVVTQVGSTVPGADLVVTGVMS